MRVFLGVFVALFCTVSSCFAVPATISGRIIDENNEPMTGATALIVGTNAYGIADIDGNFKIEKVPSSATEIEFSFLGYDTKVLSVSDEDMGDIQMVPSSNMIEAVVVTECKKEIGVKTAEYNESFKKCIPTECDTPRYVLDKGGTKNAACVDQVGKKCTGSGVPHASSYVYKLEDGKLVCVVDDCEKKWKVDGTTCVQVAGECTPTGIAHAIAGEMKNGKCIVYKCADGYKVNTANNTCVEKGEAPKEPEKPKHVATEEEIADLQAKSDAAHAKEQSTANKMIGAAGIGATGIGTMMAASALAEKKADEDAERDMAAYLETFRCDYGRGANIKGGTTSVELPGGNDLATLHIEYALLADKLARNKAALNLRPGIEGEVVIDKADTGLYDNGAIGKTGGAYASIARALQDPQGKDAAEWNALKEQTAKNLKTGAITAGVGAGGSLVANLLANADWKKANKDKSDGDKDKSDKKDKKDNKDKKDLKDLVKDPNVKKATGELKDRLEQKGKKPEEDVAKAPKTETPEDPVVPVAPPVVVEDDKTPPSGSGAVNLADFEQVFITQYLVKDDKNNKYLVSDQDVAVCSQCLDATPLPAEEVGKAQRASNNSVRANLKATCEKNNGEWREYTTASTIGPGGGKTNCCYTDKEYYCVLKSTDDEICNKLFPTPLPGGIVLGETWLPAGQNDSVVCSFW